MRKLLAALLFAIAAVSASGEKIRVGYFNLEPFMIDGGPGKGPTGATIEYYESYLAPMMGVEIEWVGPVPFVRLAAMLEDREIDAIAQLTRTAEREAKFLFTETPLTKILTCLVVAKDSPLAAVTKPEDLFGTTIGYFETGFIPPFLKSDRISFDLISNIEYRKINLDKLLSGRFASMLDINYLSMVYFVKANGYRDKVRILLLPIDPVDAYAMFAVSEKGRRLIKSFDKANAELAKSRTFEALTKKYMN